jgi:hypothetical protein
VPLYSWRCTDPDCGGSVSEFSHTAVNNASASKPPCPICGKPCEYEWATPLFVTNPTCIKKGRVSDPVARFRSNWADEQRRMKQLHPLDRKAEREAKEAGEKRIANGGGKIIVDYGKG